jgi:hypothetical protein
VGERLAAFARRRQLAESPGRLFKVKSLRARVTLAASSAIHVKSTQVGLAVCSLP